ncbi:MAG: RecQ family zinc-binding domain-containing protein [Caldilineaceae bacterium]|nr:RecQ family zinc-binding domain-containing protein [Caldilineaceae bacterium]
MRTDKGAGRRRLRGAERRSKRFERLQYSRLAKTLEGYYQETGRAGRDGLPSDCVLFFSHNDVPKLERFIGEIEDDAERENAYGKLDQVIEFCELQGCRRRYLLRYFGEEWKGSGNSGIAPGTK